MREILVCTLVMLGSVLMLVAAIGIVRLPDLLSTRLGRLTLI